MTANNIDAALAIEAARGDEYRAQLRAEGFRAGAEAMREAVLELIALRGPTGRVTTFEIGHLALPEAPTDDR